MAEVQPWRPRGDREPGTASPDREGYREDREPPTARGLDREDREGGHDDSLAVWGDDREPDDREPGDETWWSSLRFVREPRGTVQDDVDYAIHAAYTIEQSGLRTASIAFVYLIGAPLKYGLRLIEWAFTERLTRFGGAVVVTLALAVLLNRVPVAQWLVPDPLDITWWWSDDLPPGAVELPLDPGVGG